MSHISANLPSCDEKVQCHHPLLGAQTSLARKVVQMRDQPLHEVLEARIFGLIVNLDSIRRDIVDCQIEQLGSLNVLWVRHGSFLETLANSGDM